MELTEKGRAMTDDKTEHHAMSVSTFLLMFFASCAPVSPRLRQLRPLQTAPTPARHSTRNVRCVTVQTELALSLERACTFRTSTHRQSRNCSNAQLAQIISDGKATMPSFKSSLSEDQIHSLVAHIRTLRAKK
jgi:hypothetical protein